MRRVLGLAGIAAAAAVTLTGCEKPSPSVSAFSGPRSIHTEALCWAFDSDQLTPGQCAEEILTGQATEGVATLDVTGGNTVGISVDPVVAETGWQLVINGQPATPELRTTYFRFPLGAILEEDLPIQVVAGSGGRQRGIWMIRLVPSQS